MINIFLNQLIIVKPLKLSPYLINNHFYNIKNSRFNNFFNSFFNSLYLTNFKTKYNNFLNSCIIFRSSINFIFINQINQPTNNFTNCIFNSSIIQNNGAAIRSEERRVGKRVSDPV